MPFLAALGAAAPAIGAGISAVGSFLSGRENREMSRWQFRANQAEQRNFAQRAIRWRVADAKAAGLHPLYALSGGALPTYSPVFPSGDTGSASGDALEGMGATIGKMGPLIDELRGKKGQVEAPGMVPMRRETWDEEGNPTVEVEMVPYPKAVQELDIQQRQNDLEIQRLQINKERMALNPEPLTQDAVERIPDQVVMGSGGYVAGVHQGMKTWELPNGLRVDLPFSNEGLAESIEGLGVLGRAAVIAYNAERYGPAWAEAVKKSWIGRLLFRVKDLLPEYRPETEKYLPFYGG